MENLNADILKEKRDALAAEIEDFKKEKERVRQVIGSIGGKAYSKRDITINIIFFIIIVIFFVLGILMYFNKIPHFLPPYISLEVSILLVSIKIVFMIHFQHKVNHFQFWILSSIEFRINELVKNIKGIENKLSKK